MHKEELSQKENVLSIPDLGKLLPANWNQHPSYDSVEIDAEIRKRGIEVPTTNLQQNRLIDKVVEEMRGFQNWRKKEALRISGLDIESLKVTESELMRYSGLDAGEFNAISAYAPITSFLTAIFNGSLEARNIVEIGTGNDGIYALGYLASKGARTYGFDNTKPSIKPRKHDVIFKKDRWEHIGKHFDIESIDAIYVHFMEQFPQTGGPFDNVNTKKFKYKDNIDFKALYDMRRADRMAFEKHIAEDMHKILKPYGLFLISNVSEGVTPPGTEFTLNSPQRFADTGYARYVFMIEHGNQRLEVMQKDPKSGLLAKDYAKGK